MVIKQYTHKTYADPYSRCKLRTGEELQDTIMVLWAPRASTLQLILCFTFITVTGAEITNFWSDKNIYEREGINLYCCLEQQSGAISLLNPRNSTVIQCSSYNDCLQNFEGVVHDRVAGNKTCLVFSIVKPTRVKDNGVWTCLDDFNYRTDNLSLLVREPNSKETTSVESTETTTFQSSVTNNTHHLNTTRPVMSMTAETSLTHTTNVPFNQAGYTSASGCCITYATISVISMVRLF